MKRGPGRPQIGVRKQIKMTLPKEDWDQIEQLIENEHAESFADYFRQLHRTQFPKRETVRSS